MKPPTKILDQYGMLETEPSELIRESGDNQVYVIGRNDYKKILRISKRLPVKDVLFEFEAMEYLRRNDFPVAEWIKTREGNLFASADDAEVAVMFNFLDGHHANIDGDSLPTTKQAATAGRMLGTMAKLGADFTSPSTRQRNIFTEVNRALESEISFKKDFDGGEKFIDEIKIAIAFAQESKSPAGLIHNDYRVGNVFFKNDAELSGVIDFDWCCIGPRIKDLALGVLEWSCPDGRTEPDFSIFDAFLDGFNSTSVEKISRSNELYQWIMFAALSDTATFFCDRLSSPELKRKITYSYMYQKYLYFSKL